MNIINAAISCPKHDFCNSSFCPVELSGFHRKGEAICIYFRMAAKNIKDEILSNILNAIIDNQSIYLDLDYRGFMSEYRGILKKDLNIQIKVV